MSEELTRDRAPVPLREMVRTLVGCKWSLEIFRSIRAGVARPGGLVRSHAGLSTKVLNDCLRKHVSYGILEKHSFPEVPPRVEYRITEFGQRFIGILESIAALEQEFEAGLPPEGPGRGGLSGLDGIAAVNRAGRGRATTLGPRA